jgi:hypothetical protein
MKKLIGAVILVALAILYALLTTTIAVARLGDSSPWIHLLFFFLMGILWIVPAMLVIKWMAGSKKQQDQQ